MLVPRSGVHAFRPTSIIHAAVTTAVPDLLIIGGGITGAGVARDAALRGLQVTLVERDDIACGTSSRSSRLVHGGVRYLEHGHLRLVFESSRERRILLTTAPHLVRPLSFTWPVYRGTRLPRWKVGAGLALYDALSLFRNVGRHQRLNSTGVLEREAALESNALLGGFAYWDASTDDSRLTLATAVDAAVCGADIRTHTEVLELLRDGSRIVGARVANTLTGEESELRARLVVSTVGPWTDELLGRDPGAVREQQTVRGTKGVHIMLPREAAGNAGALTLIAPADGRVTFALPAGDFSLIGTTDTPTDEHPATVRASQADVAYLLNVVRHFFPGRDTSERDVVSSWAGIRPLAVAGYSDGPSSASREHSIVMHPSGMLVVTGGKLTTYRSMAAEVVDRAGLALGTRLADSGTAERPLPGGDCEPEAERAAAERETGSAALALRLSRAHGSGWRSVWSLTSGSPGLAEYITPERPYIMAEVVHAVRSEWAHTLADVLVRRVPLAFETSDHGREAAVAVSRVLASELGWNENRRESELARYESDITAIFGAQTE